MLCLLCLQLSPAQTRVTLCITSLLNIQSQQNWCEFNWRLKTQKTMPLAWTNILQIDCHITLHHYSAQVQAATNCTNSIRSFLIECVVNMRQHALYLKIQQLSSHMHSCPKLIVIIYRGALFLSQIVIYFHSLLNKLAIL